jgi:hypothetical protein
MLMMTVLPAAPPAFAPLKVICPVPELPVLTDPVKPVGGAPE